MSLFGRQVILDIGTENTNGKSFSGLTSEPGSTGKLHHAERHTSHRAAQVALTAARKHRPLRQAEIREMG